ncbi:MAG TPA: type II toxin-antitoxin system VapC family toxin [Sphingorhabdus sp.]|uniref:type II toxin-antitoxin system VapC family toxin n=1 Tax=Sphingorhabdus sp. TaxID=1902408 RepID=UPI002C84C45F|nr:type II toxin-antitoxin system VapC family toxin [Sphingorhabdus sp.]HMT40608.1 type II toxin-antitoxin system VapC family toxin [Sphingorhabdus sp.]HMU23285.1 type II toxin-antitoxin system VapC family toxin [Sphingorhabdus sp.]
MILLDTNVISELMKKPANEQVTAWYLLHEAETIISAPSLGELAFGIARLPEGRRRSGLEADLADLRVRYADRSLPFTANSANIYGDIMFDALTAKHNMNVVDGQIAAIAVENGLQLATRNIKDFRFTDLALINPWEAP